MREREVQKLNNRDIIKIVLRTIGAVGVISVALIAPNSIQMLEALGFIDGPRARHRKYCIENTFEKLKQKDLVETTISRNGTRHARLTLKGRELLQKYELKEISIPHQKQWDRKWRLVIFDIWETRRQTRDELRATLKQL